MGWYTAEDCNPNGLAGGQQRGAPVAGAGPIGSSDPRDDATGRAEVMTCAVRRGGGSVNAEAGGSPTDLGVMGTGPWSAAAGFARVRLTALCSFGPVGGTVETGMTRCTLCGRGVCGVTPRVDFRGSWLDFGGWGVNGGMPACLACTGGDKPGKSFELSEGARKSGGIPPLESAEERSLAISRSCSASANGRSLSSFLESVSLAMRNPPRSHPASLRA